MDSEIRGKWRHLRSLIHVETQTTQLDSEEVRREVRYYISSLDEPASAFQCHIRQHWSIENSCHWVLDTAFREDHNQTYIGHAAKNLGALRRIVLNLLTPLATSGPPAAERPYRFWTGRLKPALRYWQASQVPPFIMASREQAFFSASVNWGFSAEPPMWPRTSFLTSMVDFSMLEAWRVRR